MSRYVFSPHERFAVFSCHSERCYICNKPVDLKSMEVDHIIPESLLKDPPQLSKVLHELGRPSSFDLNSYANWMPACRPCNRKKSDEIFEPTPLIQLMLQRAARKTTEAAAHAAKAVEDTDVTRALNILERAGLTVEMTVSEQRDLQPLVRRIIKIRDPELVAAPVRLMPLYEVLNDSDGILTIRGRYGIGGRPSSPSADASFNCVNCGTAGAWSGPRCVVCGQMDDD